MQREKRNYEKIIIMINWHSTRPIRKRGDWIKSPGGGGGTRWRSSSRHLNMAEKSEKKLQFDLTRREDIAYFSERDPETQKHTRFHMKD